MATKVPFMEREFSPLEQAIHICDAVASSRHNFEITKILFESEKPLRIKDMPPLVTPSLHIPRSSAQSILATLRDVGIAIKDNAGQYTATSVTPFVLETIRGLEGKILANKTEKIFAPIETHLAENRREDVRASLQKSYQEESLALAVETYGTLAGGRSKGDCFKIAEVLYYADQPLTFGEIYEQIQPTGTRIPMSTLSLQIGRMTLTRITSQGDKQGIRRDTYNITETGRYAVESIHCLGKRLAEEQISHRVSVLQRAGANLEAVKAYRTALKTQYGLKELQ